MLMNRTVALQLLFRLFANDALRLQNADLRRRFLSAQARNHNTADDSTPTDSPDSSARNAPTDKTRNEKLLKVAIVGVPNAGKSTFINNLLNHRICPTSSKVHTTRQTAKAIHVRNNDQLILFDTPGLVSEAEQRRYEHTATFGSAQRHSIQHADLIGIVHDVSNTWTRHALHPTVLATLQAYPKVPSFLVLNKIDALKSKRVLLDLARSLTDNTLNGVRGAQPDDPKRPAKRRAKTADETTTTATVEKAGPVGWPGFSDVFMLSSLTGDGMAAVMKYLLGKTRSGAWEHAADEFTDQPPEQLIVQSVRARLLDFMPQEIPYQLRSEIEFFSRDRVRLYASVLVHCPSERIERLVCGDNGGRLHQITERVTSDLIETFGVPISLTLTTRAPRKE